MPLTRHLSVPFMASRPSMRLCNHHYHPPPGSFHLAELKPVPIKCKCVCAKSCPTPCDPMDCSLPSSSVHEILQARILEWIAISFSRGSSDPGIEPGSPALEADALTSVPPGNLHAWGHTNAYAGKVRHSCHRVFSPLPIHFHPEELRLNSVA